MRMMTPLFHERSSVRLLGRPLDIDRGSTRLADLYL